MMENGQKLSQSSAGSGRFQSLSIFISLVQGLQLSLISYRVRFAPSSFRGSHFSGRGAFTQIPHI